jgi:hypothetical protein
MEKGEEEKEKKTNFRGAREGGSRRSNLFNIPYLPLGCYWLSYYSSVLITGE